MNPTFTLVLDIRGLCLLVPHTDETTGIKQMHVLLPESHGTMKHIARLTFHREYNADASSNRVHEDFDGVRWDLSDLLNTGADLTLPDVVVPVHPFVRTRGIRRKQVKKSGQVRVSSHLILSAGAYTCHGRSALWTIGGQEHVPMTNHIRWVIEGIPGTELKWEFRTHNGHVSKPGALKAVDGHIFLDLLHAPEGEHARQPDRFGLDACKPDEPNHFHMYYPLFEATSSKEPRCEGPVLDGQCRDGSEFPPSGDKGPNVFSCMLGQAKVDPDS